MGRHVDFDAAWAEQVAAAGDPSTITVRGETIILPPELPARVVLLDASQKLTVFELLGMLVGTAQADAWYEAGMGIEEAKALLGRIGRVYTEDPLGEAPARPNRATRRATKKAPAQKRAAAARSTSSTSGRSSKASSKRTTGST